MAELIAIPLEEFNGLKATVEETRAMVAKLMNQIGTKEETWYSTVQATSKWMVSDATLFNKEKAGLMQPKRSGRSVQWSQTQLDANFKRRA